MDEFLIGVDVGGTKSAAVIGTRSGDVLFRREALTPHIPGDWRPAVDSLIGLVQGVCSDGGVDASEAGAAGVSCGGPLDHRTGVVYSPPNLPEWSSVPLRAILSESLSVARVIVENDANATALAENRWGAGMGANNMAFLTFGTGIGAGLILNGELFRGKRDLAGEVGHAVILPGGPLCLCKKRGCLEAVASGTAIGRLGSDKLGRNVSAADICDLAREGDLLAREVLDDAGRYMGIGLANLLQTLDLERIVLGTLAVYASDLLLPQIIQSLRANCWKSIWDGVEVVPAGLGAEAQDKAALAVALLAVI